MGRVKINISVVCEVGLEEELRELPLPQPGSNRGYEGIEIIDIVGQRNIGLVRADSGFFSEKCLEYLESKVLNYYNQCKVI